MRLPWVLSGIIALLILLVVPVGAQEPGGVRRPGGTEPSVGGEGPAVQLAGIVDLGSLSLLWEQPDTPAGDPASPPEPLDITATENGPVLLYSDRVLSLGVDLEITTRTVQDLSALPLLPRGVVPSRILLNPLGEPMVYDAGSGSLHLLHYDGGDSETFETELPQAIEAESLQRGGLVLSDGKRLALFSRNEGRLTRREITLPAVFTTGLSVDELDRLWVYDLVSRQVRVFDRAGEELFAVTPEISGATLLFPQVFRARRDGSFFLGTAGELWCFNADGSLRWRLTQFSAGLRQALPAFYRLAVAGGDNTDGAFYILDPLGNRLLKFIEGAPSAGSMAAAFRSYQAGHSGTNELLRLCMERQLYLQAAFFRRSGNDQPLITDLAQRIREKQAGALAELAEQLETELRYPEAEASLNQSLRLYRELRGLDPVDPRYPEEIRELTERRNTLRDIRVAESRLEARMADGDSVGEAGGRGFVIVAKNTSGDSLEEMEVLARFSGYTRSGWRATRQSIRPGGEVLLSFDLGAGSRPSNSEDLAVLCNLLVRYVYNGESSTEHFRLPLLIPAGTLELPDDG